MGLDPVPGQHGRLPPRCRKWAKQVILLYLCFRQILPDSDVKPEGDFDELLGNGKTVILYLHGTTGTRY